MKAGKANFAASASNGAPESHYGRFSPRLASGHAGAINAPLKLWGGFSKVSFQSCFSRLPVFEAKNVVSQGKPLTTKF
jgi:hypothetical protein